MGMLFFGTGHPHHRHLTHAARAHGHVRWQQWPNFVIQSFRVDSDHVGKIGGPSGS